MCAHCRASGDPPGPTHATRTHTLRMPAKTPLAGDKIDAPPACAVPFRPYCGSVVTLNRHYWGLMRPIRLGAGILRNAESCQGVICGKLSAERSANYSLSLFPHSAAEKFRISGNRKTTVRSHCTTDVQPMHTSVRHPMVP